MDYSAFDPLPCLVEISSSVAKGLDELARVRRPHRTWYDAVRSRCLPSLEGAVFAACRLVALAHNPEAWLPAREADELGAEARKMLAHVAKELQAEGSPATEDLLAIEAAASASVSAFDTVVRTYDWVAEGVLSYETAHVVRQAACCLLGAVAWAAGIADGKASAADQVEAWTTFKTRLGRSIALWRPSDEVAAAEKATAEGKE